MSGPRTAPFSLFLRPAGPSYPAARWAAGYCLEPFPQDQRGEVRYLYTRAGQIC